MLLVILLLVSAQIEGTPSGTYTSNAIKDPLSGTTILSASDTEFFSYQGTEGYTVEALTDGLWDCEPTHGWQSDAGPAHWIKVKLQNAVVPLSYSLKSKEDCYLSGYPSKHYQFLASNDNLNWELLSTSTDSTENWVKKSVITTKAFRFFKWFFEINGFVDGNGKVDVFEAKIEGNYPAVQPPELVEWEDNILTSSIGGVVTISASSVLNDGKDGHSVNGITDGWWDCFTKSHGWASEDVGSTLSQSWIEVRTTVPIIPASYSLISKVGCYSQTAENYRFRVSHNGVHWITLDISTTSTEYWVTRPLVVGDVGYTYFQWLFTHTDYIEIFEARIQGKAQTATPPVPTPSLNDEVLIWSCKKDGVVNMPYDLAVIQKYAETADQIIIRSQLDQSQYVNTSDPFILDSLRLGKTLALPPIGSSNAAVWQGTKLDKLWNSCSTAASFIDTPYGACYNPTGLYLSSSFCRWDRSQPPPVGGLEIVIRRKLDEFVPIYRCVEDTKRYSLYLDSAIPMIGQTASVISIYTTNKRSTDYIQTTPNSYALASLAKGTSLSYKVDGSYADISDWDGTKVNDTLWNNCGSAESFNKQPYWACGNPNGLHLMADKCRWSYSQSGPAGGITVAVKPTSIATYRLVAIYTCSDTVKNKLVYPLDEIKRLASLASGITIMSRQNSSEYVTTTSSKSFALDSLRAGKALSWTTSGYYAIVSDWMGPMVDRLWNSCGSPVSFESAAYWACNNGGGLHLNINTCAWDNANSPVGGIAVYLHFDYSSFAQTGLSFVEEQERMLEKTETGSASSLVIGLVVVGSVVGTVFLITLLVVIKKRQVLIKNEELQERML